jgi:hypothetical protein
MARDARPSDLTRPGHVFPLIAKPGGVLRRTGQTEGSVDLARLAGLEPAGVICEIMNDDGTMARMPDLRAFAQQHGLRILTVADLIKYRLRTESHVVRGAEASVPSHSSVPFVSPSPQTAHWPRLAGASVGCPRMPNETAEPRTCTGRRESASVSYWKSAARRQ